MPSPIPVRLPTDLVAWLDQQARDSAETRSTVVRGLLREAMTRQQRQASRRKPQAHSDAQEG